MTKFEIEECIKKYGIWNPKDGRIGIKGKTTPKDIELIKSNKAEILQYFADRERESAEESTKRQAKIDTIKGLQEIKNAIAEWNNYYYIRDKAFESECGRMPNKPETSIDELKKMYPRAAAYIKADSYSNSTNYKKAVAGKKAIERIVEGEDYEIVIKNMESEWSAHCEGHIWD